MTQEDGSRQPIHVAYLGPEASFSHQAALAVFPPSSSATLHPLPSFAAIFSALQSPSEGDPDYHYALLPVENSTNGSVVQVLDLLSTCSESQYPDLQVCAEHYLSVHHCLFTSSSPTQPATNGANTNTTTTTPPSKTPYSAITTLYTHPQVWGQCARFLSTHFPPLTTERIDVSSTSAAARLVAQDPSGHSAAISSSLAGKLHNLHCLATNIEDEPDGNTTRFFVMRNRGRRTPPLPPPPPPTPQQQQQSSPITRLQLEPQNFKSLITFTIPHHLPGSLAATLAVFRSFNFNLTSIDTRPSRRRNWQYVFLVECEERRSRIAGEGKGQEQEAEEEESNLRAMLKELGRLAERWRYLGSWVDELQDQQNGESGRKERQGT